MLIGCVRLDIKIKNYKIYIHSGMDLYKVKKKCQFTLETGVKDGDIHYIQDIYIYIYVCVCVCLFVGELANNIH
jgi:hypothetical protein